MGGLIDRVRTTRPTRLALRAAGYMLNATESVGLAPVFLLRGTKQARPVLLRGHGGEVRRSRLSRHLDDSFVYVPGRELTNLLACPGVSR